MKAAFGAMILGQGAADPDGAGDDKDLNHVRAGAVDLLMVGRLRGPRIHGFSIKQ